MGNAGNNAGQWHWVEATVTGVAHHAAAMPSQDACAVQCRNDAHGAAVLILAVADGAGSATHAEQGAELACKTFLDQAVAWLAENVPHVWNADVGETWLRGVRSALQQHADASALPLRELACTLLGAVIAGECALFLQVGDGAIIIDAGDQYRTVFWPQGGEYPNETFFVTDSDLHWECAVLNAPITEVALLSDGLQALALHYQSRQAYQRFFAPLFARLRADAGSGYLPELTTALRNFLDSPAINQRTHDDKTLILAGRCPPSIPVDSDESA